MADASPAPPAPLLLLEGLATTRAIRRYRDEPIPDADLATMFFAATRAPQGSNRQGFRFVVLRDGPNAAEARQLLQSGAARPRRGPASSGRAGRSACGAARGRRPVTTPALAPAPTRPRPAWRPRCSTSPTTSARRR